MYNLRQPYHKTNKNYSLPFFVLIFLMLSILLLNLVFVVHRTDTVPNIIYLVFAVIPWFFLLATTFINPGYLKTKINA